MSPSEFKFREAEKALDAAVRDVGARLEAIGARIQDRSLRQHQRGEYLSLTYEFTKVWELEVETARVRVSLSFGEPVDVADAAEVRVWRCAEQFRPGQLSRVREISESVLSLQALSDSRLGDLVVLEMEKGAHVLCQAL
jgi:hypothetical protein